MNYYEFNKYCSSISTEVIRMDDLNPYPIADSITISSSSKNLSFGENYCGKTLCGVRPILEYLFGQFTANGYSLCLPEDVYPRYFELVPTVSNTARYKSFQVSNFNLPAGKRCVVLVTNPLVPEGRYLTDNELQGLDKWVSASTNRWIIFDGVYDYKNKSTIFSFNSKNVIYTGSKSKTHLAPRNLGWALCKKSIFSLGTHSDIFLNINLSQEIQLLHEAAWRFIANSGSLPFRWNSPEVGYMTAVNEDYRHLLSEYNIAAIPGTVFGITKTNTSIISCLSQVKHDLF